MPSLFARYTHWLHLRWPAGRVEKLPVVQPDGSCAIPGVRVVGDLTGVPLLKFAVDSGARAARAIGEELRAEKQKPAPESNLADLAIIGGGVAGMAAALEAKKLGLTFVVFEAAEAFSTLVNFPKGKPIFTYPTDFSPAGDMTLTADVKEALVAELESQRRAAGIEPRRARIDRIERRDGVLLLHHPDGQPFRARRVIIAIGRSGNHRKLGVSGEQLDKVFNRLHDPKEYAGQNVLVVGGGDSALEAATALAKSGARVTLSYRGENFSRAKPENTDAVSAADVSVRFKSQVESIASDHVRLKTPIGSETLPNDVVFSLIGREAPLDFFRRSGIPIQGETKLLGWLALAAFIIFCAFVYLWKGGALADSVANPSAWTASLRASFSDRSTLLGTLFVSMQSRSFYYTLGYSLCILIFGLDRMRRRRTPYVRRQTWTLMAVQWLPLFLLPELILPWLGYNGLFSSGLGANIADNLFESYISPDNYAAALWPEWGHPRAYWRAYGFILAWPLNVYNTFTASPHWWWLGIGFVQTFVLIPWLVIRYGKGAYCGWICSCGALAETMGDRHRQKMPHGPFWNKLNFIGQAFLAIAALMLVLRIVGWLAPNSVVAQIFPRLLEGKNADGSLSPYFIFSYKWFIDVLCGGVLGVGLYFKYSGRVWCRFACPLAALMHLYARFSQFRIFAEKKKCISCNVCTSVCHQGIDIMSFANKGAPMEDPECVRCSACVQSCPTGVLSFGRLLSEGRPLFDDLPASTAK